MLLLRHASAGQRLSSPDIDRFRQLDHTGRAEARQLIWTLGEQRIDRVVTSPLARCVETVIPIAESRHVVIERRDELLPEAPLEAILELLDEFPDTTLVCTHREVILQLFEGELTCAKGATWVIERIDSLWSPTLYIPPPAAVAEPFPRFASAR